MSSDGLILQASRTSIFRNATFTVLVYTIFISAMRIMALWNNYHAPYTVLYHLESAELPRLLNVTGLLPPTPPKRDQYDESPHIDISAIREFGLVLCVGKEWHRFPGNFFVPAGVATRLIKSEFDGLIPGRFPERDPKAGLLDRIAGTSAVPQGQNDLNQERLAHYVSGATSFSLLLRTHTLHSIRWTSRRAIIFSIWISLRIRGRPKWSLVTQPTMPTGTACTAKSSSMRSTPRIPGEKWRSQNEYGDYCLLRSKALERPGGKVGAIKALHANATA
jgi:alpha-1,2-mannosyltransferase